MLPQLFLIMFHYPKNEDKIIEDTLHQASEEIEENSPSVSATTNDNLEIRQVDKAIDSTPKMKSTHTQYSISHNA